MRRSFGVCAIAYVVSGVLQAAAPADCSQLGQSFDDGRNAIVLALLEHRDVTLELLTRDGCFDSVVRKVQGLGVTPILTDPKIGYIDVEVAAGQVLQVLRIGGIQYFHIPLRYDDPDIVRAYGSANVPYESRKPAPVPPIQIPTPEVATEATPDGPFFDAKAAGLEELWKLYPQADGRGVRIAIPDYGIDLFHPALREAWDRAGHPIPKVADIAVPFSINSRPVDDSDWVRFDAPVVAHDREIESAGEKWKTPGDGRFSIGIFATGLPLGGRLTNREAKKLPLSVGVLWDRVRNLVWVDTDGCKDFSRHRALADYGLHQDTDYFGSKTGDQDNRIPFGVKIDLVHQYVFVALAGGHGTWVGGPAAGNTRTGGLYNGAAPGAQIVDVRHGNTNFLSAMDTAFRREDADVVNASRGVSETFERAAIARMVEVYRKPVTCVCTGQGLINVRDYQSAEMLRRNRQLPPPHRDAVERSPHFEEDGLENTIMAPSANLNTESRYEPLDFPGSDGRRHSGTNLVRPPAPAGYGIGSNPSDTIAVVTGVLADLIGLAREQHVRFNNERLAAALFAGARQVPNFPINAQAHGRMDAAGAWKQLVSMAKADDPANPQLTHFEVEREKQGTRVRVFGYSEQITKPTEQFEQELSITRRGGYRGPRSYHLTLLSDDQVFHLRDSHVVFPRDKSVVVRFQVTSSPGPHLAYLQLLDDGAGAVMGQIPLTLFVPEAPAVVSAGVERWSHAIPARRNDTLYFLIGEGIQAIAVALDYPWLGDRLYSNFSMSFPGASERFAITPSGTLPPGPALDPAHHVGPIQHFERVTLNPEPGLGDLYWENRSRPEYETAYGPTAPDVSIHPSLTLTNYAVQFQASLTSVRITNRLAEASGRVEFFAATAQLHTLQTASAGWGAKSLNLPAGLAAWRVRVTQAPGNSVTADAYLLSCTTSDGKRRCEVGDHRRLGAVANVLSVIKPKAGEWVISVLAVDHAPNNREYTINEARLEVSGGPRPFEIFRSSETREFSPPQGARYAAFRIALPTHVGAPPDGPLIGMTALTAGFP